MKQTLFCVLITIMVQFIACYPADDTSSSLMSNMTAFANKTESSMQSMISSTNSSRSFTSTKSNLLLEAAKNLDISNIASDEEFLRLLFESVFSIIKDTAEEGVLLFSDLTIIVPTIIGKIIKQLQDAFFNIFFGGFVNAGLTAADMGIKIASALETGKLSVAQQGVETAQDIANTIAANVPSNGITDGISKIVNTTLDGAGGAIKAAINFETNKSDAISKALNSFKFVNAGPTAADVGIKIASVLETGKLSVAQQGVETAQDIANTIAATVPSNGITDGISKLVNAGPTAADVGIKIASALETGKLSVAQQGVETAQDIANTIAANVPSNGITDGISKIVNTTLDGAGGVIKAAINFETKKSDAISKALNIFKFGK